MDRARRAARCTSRRRAPPPARLAREDERLRPTRVEHAVVRALAEPLGMEVVRKPVARRPRGDPRLIARTTARRAESTSARRAPGACRAGAAPRVAPPRSRARGSGTARGGRSARAACGRRKPRRAFGKRAEDPGGGEALRRASAAEATSSTNRRGRAVSRSREPFPEVVEHDPHDPVAGGQGEAPAANTIAPAGVA